MSMRLSMSMSLKISLSIHVYQQYEPRLVDEFQLEGIKQV